MVAPRADVGERYLPVEVNKDGMEDIDYIMKRVTFSVPTYSFVANMAVR